MATKLSRFLLALALGSLLFAAGYAAVISGAISPPPGYEPAWVLRNVDTPQYMTWLHAAQNEILIRDYHAPWRTEPAIWQPLMLIAARIGLPPLAGYYALHFALYVLACWALLYAAAVFCPGRQMWFALAFAACAVPLRLLAWPIALMFKSPSGMALAVSGLLDYGYETADGLFRGGVSTSLTLTAGTLSMLLAMALLAQYVETSQRKYFHLLCGVTFLSALLHPFEVFVIVTASAVPLLLRREAVSWIAVGISGAAGMLPYVYTSVRSAWVRDSSESLHAFYHPAWILVNFGIPCFVLVSFLLIRFRMPARRDVVLRSWFISVPLLAMIPGIVVPTHLMDGFAYCIGFLLARRIACDPQLRSLLGQHRAAVYTTLTAIASLTMVALGVFYVEVWRDGRRADPQLLVSSVRPVYERPLLEWVATHTARDTLVLSPPELAPWVATIPRPSFASHDVSSITFPEQRQQAESFYGGKLGSADLLQNYGVGIVVVPSGSPALASLPMDAWRLDIGGLRVYQFPEAQMKAYPGLEKLGRIAKPSISHRVFQWIDELFGSK